MKLILSTAALSLFAATAALAGQGYVTTNISLRAGPDSGYPDVAMLYAGTTVAIEGCVDGWSWCDIATGDSRGWVPANYLQQEYQGRRVLIPEYGVRIGIPVITFVFGSYWDHYYSHRSWYGERERWSLVRPQYQTLIVNGDGYRRSNEISYGTSRGDLRASRTRNQRMVVESRQSRVVATQPSYQSRPANRAAPQRSVTTEVRSPRKYANQERRSVESRAIVRQQSRTTEVRSQENHANHARQMEPNAAQSRPMATHKVSQPRMIAERKVAQPRASKKDMPAKSRSDHQGGKDVEQH